MRIKTIFGMLAVSTGLWISSDSQCHGGVIVALTQSNELLSFDTSTPGTTSAPVAISGVTAGDSLIGIDYRPSNGLLYGLATDSLGTTGRIYTIDTITGVASFASQISTSLSGSFFGVDFNPVADRLRVISDSGQSLRINVADGATIVDGSLAYGMGDPNFGTPPAVFASAYTNSFAGATSTALYNIDSATQSLVLQNPPNPGTLSTIGSLGDISFAESSFDIDGASNIGYAVFNGVDLLQVDLATGATSILGPINTSSSIIGISTGVSAVPEPSSILLLGVGAVGIRIAKKRRLKKHMMIKPTQV